MRAEDRAEFVRLLSDVMAFYRQDCSEFAISVWLQACDPFDMEQVRKAMTAHATDPERGQFAPKPADIVKALQGTHADASLLVWGMVHGAMATVGAYRSVDFGSPAIHAAITDLGGWPFLCRTSINDLPFVQKRFCDSYRVYRARGADGAPAYLAGESESMNALNGKPVAEPERLRAKAEPPMIAPAAQEARRRAMEALGR